MYSDVIFHRMGKDMSVAIAIVCHPRAHLKHLAHYEVTLPMWPLRFRSFKLWIAYVSISIGHPHWLFVLYIRTSMRKHTVTHSSALQTPRLQVVLAWSIAKPWKSAIVIHEFYRYGSGKVLRKTTSSPVPGKNFGFVLPKTRNSHFMYGSALVLKCVQYVSVSHKTRTNYSQSRAESTWFCLDDSLENSGILWETASSNLVE